MDWVRRIIWILLGACFIAIGIKTGFIDHYAVVRGRGRPEGYSGTGATVFGCVFIALGLLTIYFVITAKKEESPNPNICELTGWRLTLYKTMKALWLG